MKRFYSYLFVLLVASLAAVSAQQDQACLSTCGSNNNACTNLCKSYALVYREGCRTYCRTNAATCRSNCPVAAAENPPATVQIARGACGSQQFYAFNITCAIPGTTPDMRLQISVLRQISSISCIRGQNFGVAGDNSFMWVSSGCAAEFSISSVASSTSNAAPTTTTTIIPTTTTTIIPTTTTTSRPTPTTTSIPTTTTTQVSRKANSGLCGQVGDNGFRIIGGTEADNCEFPWMVMIYNQLTQSVCGGTIIDNRHILSASHCFFSKDARTRASTKARANELIIFSGSSSMPFGIAGTGGQIRRSASEIITHERYNDSTLENDVAIVKLTTPITFDACHKPLCMVDGSKTPQQATNCRTMGWGLASNGPDADIQTQLKYVDVPVASDAACRGIYGSLSSQRTFCAGSSGKDACQGDSGGPFACKEADGRYYVYGVVSAGIDQNCGNSLGIYTRVSTFLTWITSKTN